MQEKSIIKVVHDENNDIHGHIAMITGKSYVPKPNYYHNEETNEDYWEIVGALAFPANRTEGFGVFVAAVKGAKPDEPIFKVIDELEENSLEGLLNACECRRWKWGYPHHLQHFYGDPERFMSIVCDFNRKSEHGLYLIHPADFQAANRSEIYLERIWSYLRPDEDGNKRLVLGESERIRAHLQNLPKDVQAIEDYPAIAALGYAVHSLESLKPWMRSVAKSTGRYIDFEDDDDY